MTAPLPAETRLAAFKHAIANRYLIDYEIGRGGMAVVYVAREIRLGRSVAVKVLAPSAASPSAVTAFRREITRTLHLEHPHILPIFDADEAEGLPFYVMRFVRDGSLRGRLDRKGRLGVAETVRVIQQTAAALGHSHSQRILHCDVKPENILLDGGHVYLVDFGVSRAVREDERRASTEIGGGTARYMSPEQALGELAIDGRTDVYSLACVAYEMLAGHPPFTGIASVEKLPGDVPDSIRTAIAQALSVAPEQRQRSVTDFAAALEERPVQRVRQALVGAVERVFTMADSLLFTPQAPAPRP
ncbi:MAG TPA: serine/threonine-protein kinase [Gemmatimonadales bacterium]|nr:serine/threonine-protein kinase [Gemmatimonadales bacterium]